jgi:hypothetical protein
MVQRKASAEVEGIIREDGLMVLAPIAKAKGKTSTCKLRCPWRSLHVFSLYKPSPWMQSMDAFDRGSASVLSGYLDDFAAQVTERNQADSRLGGTDGSLSLL